MAAKKTAKKASKAKTNELVYVCLVQGVCGSALYINDLRVSGEKPWGGGNIVWETEVTRADIDEALARHVH